jgi:chromosomal replication initiation ATPase DnaA
MTIFSPGPSEARKRIEAAGWAYQHREEIAAKKAAEAARRAAADHRRRVLADMAQMFVLKGKRERPISDIVHIVAEARGYSVKEFCGPSRRRELCHARQEAMYLCLKAGHAANAVARFLQKNHTSVLHGAKVHAARMEAAK